MDQVNYGEKGALPSPDGESSRSYDMDTRRRAALAEIDNAKFGWFHVKACLVAGVGFFTDAYDIFTISLAATMLGYAYNSQNGHKGKLTGNQDLGVKIATPVGTLCGQLLFGWLADRYGRKKMYGIELMIIIVGTIGQAVSGQAHGVTIIGVLVWWRFFMGLGIGGDYPLSAVITSEFAATRIRGRMMTAVFASQGWGQFTAAIVSTVVVTAYKGKLLADPAGNPETTDIMWRWVIGLGVVPAIAGLYFRLTISETPRFQMDVERNVEDAARVSEHLVKTGQFHGAVDEDRMAAPKVEVPAATRADFFRHFGQWRNGKILFGTSWSWFALDIAFYGLGQNSAIVLAAIGFGGTPTGTANEIIYKTLRNAAIGNIILSVAGLIPGYWVSFLFIDSWGRKPIQLMGFIMLTILFCIMGFGYHALTNTAAGRRGFVAVYCLTNFFQNFGPNTTTFIVPGEIFPTRYRSTAHGISAASGKLGAIVAQILVFKIKDIGGAAGSNHFLNHVLEIFAFFMLTGIFSTLLIPETKGQSLEDLSNESQEGFVGRNKH